MRRRVEAHEIVMLREAMSLKEIAEHLGCSISLLSKTLQEAGQSLPRAQAAALAGRRTSKAPCTPLGELIQAHLDRREWTRAELARRVGVHDSAVRHWILGRVHPRPRQLVALAEVLEVGPEDLFRKILIEIEEESDD